MSMQVSASSPGGWDPPKKDKEKKTDSFVQDHPFLALAATATMIGTAVLAVKANNAIDDYAQEKRAEKRSREEEEKARKYQEECKEKEKKETQGGSCIVM